MVERLALAGRAPHLINAATRPSTGCGFGAGNPTGVSYAEGRAGPARVCGCERWRYELSPDGFHHEALFYSGDDDFPLGTLPFILQGLERGEAVLVVERKEKASLLRRGLGEDASGVLFADMDAVGANPARIIPAWQDFVDRHGQSGGRMRGIGEPILAARPGDELVECQRHESLLNVAFAAGRPRRLPWPVRTRQLPAAPHHQG